MSPEQALDVTWRVWQLPMAGRLEALRTLAVVTVVRPRGWDKSAIRREEIRIPRPRLCFACGSGEHHLYWHHVIAVSNGGDNDPYNTVAICHECHRFIHPWMREGDSSEDVGLQLAGDSLNRMIRLGRWHTGER